MVQWLGLHAFTAEGVGSIPVWGTKDPTSWGGAAKEKKKKVTGNVIQPYLLVVLDSPLAHWKQRKKK